MQGLPHPMCVSIIGKGGLARRRRWWRPPATCGALTPFWPLTTPGSLRLLLGRGSNFIYCRRCPGRGGGRIRSLGATGRGFTLSCGLPSHRLTLCRCKVRLDLGRGAGGCPWLFVGWGRTWAWSSRGRWGGLHGGTGGALLLSPRWGRTQSRECCRRRRGGQRKPQLLLQSGHPVVWREWMARAVESRTQLHSGSCSGQLTAEPLFPLVARAGRYSTWVSLALGMDAVQEWRKGAHPAWVAAPLLAKNPPWK